MQVIGFARLDFEFTSYAKKENDDSNNFKNFKSEAKSFGAFKTYSGSLVNKWVEPGKFFRRSMLKEGTVMPMPDIRDQMPKRSFLPRAILSKLPFSSSRISDLKRVFKVVDGSAMDNIMMLRECERAPTQGETKQCTGSIEDMVDFVTSVLGSNVTVWTT